MLVLMCVVLYSIWSRSLRLSYHSNQDELHLSAVNRRLSYIASIPLVFAIVLGLWQPKVLNDAITAIIAPEAVMAEEVALPELEEIVPTEEYETMTGATTEVVDEPVMEEEIEETTVDNLDDNGDVL